MKVNNYFTKSIGGTKSDFVDFIKTNNQNLEESDLRNIDFLAKRVAENLFYYEDNINTAKSDYITLLGLLIKKGVLFELK